MILKQKLFCFLNQSRIRTLSYWKMRHWYANLVKPKPVDPPYGHVIQIGDPRLRAPSENIAVDDIKTSDIQVLIKCMRYVFNKYKCVGLSAPQIGVDLKLFLMEFNENHAKQFSQDEFKTKEMSLVPFTVVLNPEMKVSDYTKIIHTESCESIKGFWADVPRFRSVVLNGYNENGEKINIKATGWVARIIQHEMDHLNGKLYTDIMDRASLTCACWHEVNERQGKVILPYRPD